MPKVAKGLSLFPDRAAQALSILIDEGKLKMQDVARALRRREKMVRELRERLASLGEEISGAVRTVRRRAQTKARRPAKTISKAQRAARQAQGRYLGAIRRLPAEARARVKAIRQKAGVRAAIAAAKRMAEA